LQALLEKNDINSQELQMLLEAREEGKVDFVLIDVREDMEYSMSHIKGVDMLKPTSTFQDWGEELFGTTQDQRVVFTCRTGSRSGQIASMFTQNGHKNAINHYGGIMSYRGETEK